MIEERVAAVLKGPKNVEIERLKIPELSADEVLIRVRACGVCGSDIASYLRGKRDGEPPPVVIGHEFSGEIVELGDLASKSGLKVGDRVIGEPFQPCKICNSCRKGSPNLCENPIGARGLEGGAFSDYSKMNFHYAHKFPDTLSFEEAAFTEPFACALSALEKIDPRPGDNVVVIGPGPIGLMMAQYLKALGLKVMLIGTRDYRLEAGLKLGVDHVFNLRVPESQYYTSNVADSVRDLAKDRGVNSVLVATGNVDANQLALKLGSLKSRIILFGGGGFSPKDWIKLYLWENTLLETEIRFSWLSSFTFSKAIQAIGEKVIDVKSLITHTYPLKDLNKAIEILHNRLENVLKVMIKP